MGSKIKGANDRIGISGIHYDCKPLEFAFIKNKGHFEMVFYLPFIQIDNSKAIRVQYKN